MSFFDQFNASSGSRKSKYLRNSELPLFVVMKVLHIEPAVTVIGSTHKVNAMLGGEEIFFYLNEADHKKLLSFDGCAALIQELNAGRSPYCFSVKRNSGLGVVFVPFSEYDVFNFGNSVIL